MAGPDSNSKHKSKLTLPAGATPMRFVDISGSEGVNKLSKFYLRGVADTAVDLTKVIGKAVDVEIALSGDRLRKINLMVVSGRFAGEFETGLMYELELQPWIWLASKRVNARIFSKLKAPEILTQMFNEYATGGQLVSHLKGDYPELEYTVQYMESDLDFMLRLMEEFGINYHIEMRGGGHDVVLTDKNSDFKAGVTADIKYSSNESTLITGGEFLSTLSEQRNITSGSVRMIDYNFQTATASMESTSQIQRNYTGSGKEIFEYPGRYTVNGDGAKLAQRRIDGIRLPDLLARAAGQALSLAAGTTINVTGHPDSTLNGKYVVLEANHHYSANSYRTGPNKGADTYRGDYVLIGFSNPVAPQRITARPRMAGPTTAVVVDGADGSEDSDNRIKVSFHWDRAGESMPCRVAQPWAGSGWGTHFIPRVGMEVVVVFIDGDPDRPMVTGCVYNSTNRAPWTLPGDKSISGMKSATMSGSGYNEISIDDKAGAEKIVIHAQYDMNTTVEHDMTTNVNNNMTTEVVGDEKLTIKKTSTTEVTETMKVTSHNNMTLTSDTQIELVCGQSKITMTPTSIKITSMDITVSAVASLTTAALKAAHGATADLAITSAMVRINS